jgi:hypothetical protein
MTAKEWAKKAYDRWTAEGEKISISWRECCEQAVEQAVAEAIAECEMADNKKCARQTGEADAALRLETALVGFPVIFKHVLDCTSHSNGLASESADIAAACFAYADAFVAEARKRGGS